MLYFKFFYFDKKGGGGFTATMMKFCRNIEEKHNHTILFSSMIEFINLLYFFSKENGKIMKDF